MKDSLDILTARLVRQYALACEALTEQQLAEAIRQALQCGDFQRLVSVDGGQQVVYIPFAREQQLENQIEDMRKTGPFTLPNEPFDYRTSYETALKLLELCRNETDLLKNEALLLRQENDRLRRPSVVELELNAKIRTLRSENDALRRQISGHSSGCCQEKMSTRLHGDSNDREIPGPAAGCGCGGTSGLGPEGAGGEPDVPTSL